MLSRYLSVTLFYGWFLSSHSHTLKIKSKFIVRKGVNWWLKEVE